MTQTQRPERRDRPTRRASLPDLRYRPLYLRLARAAIGSGTKEDNQQYKREGFLTLYRSTSHHRWDVTAIENHGDVVIYLNGTRIARLYRESDYTRNEYTAGKDTLSLFAEPSLRIPQVQMWLNRVLTANHCQYRIVQFDWAWWLHDRVYDPTRSDMEPFTDGFTITLPDKAEVLRHV